MNVDIFTYNERISDYLCSLLKKEAEVDTSESDNLPLYYILDCDLSKINIKEMDRLVNSEETGDISAGGGYEVRNNKTGEILRIKKSLEERIASQPIDDSSLN